MMTPRERRRLATGLAFISPWILGFLALCLYPLLASVYYSLCDYSVLSPAVFTGLRNYMDLAVDEVFWKALSNTLHFAALSIPLGLVLSLSLALLLNVDVPLRGVFRTVFFLPSLVPMVCLAVLWQWMLNAELGLVNSALNPLFQWINGVFGTALRPPNWLADPRYALWGLVFAGLWGVGHPVVIYLAGLQEVPRHLLEAAEIDGANALQRFWHVTLPALSPVIYFNTVMALIGSFQVFAVPYVMTGGGDGPERSLLFIATYLYQNAFDFWNMGYACAVGVVLFLLILALTLLGTRLGERHVHYEGR